MELFVYIAIFSAVFGLGMGAGYVLGYHRKPPIIMGAKINANLVIDPETLHQIDLAMVNAWLNKHGLTWQPKGAVFDPGKAVK